MCLGVFVITTLTASQSDSDKTGVFPATGPADCRRWGVVTLSDSEGRLSSLLSRQCDPKTHISVLNKITISQRNISEYLQIVSYIKDVLDMSVKRGR